MPVSHVSNSDTYLHKNLFNRIIINISTNKPRETTNRNPAVAGKEVFENVNFFFFFENEKVQNFKS